MRMIIVEVKQDKGTVKFAWNEDYVSEVTEFVHTAIECGTRETHIEIYKVDDNDLGARV
jgi:hypothetical protein